MRIRQFFEEIGLQRLLRLVRLQRLPRSMRLQRLLRPEISLLRTSVVQLLEFFDLRTYIALF